MGLSSALNTSLNGLRLNETKIDIIGNNIANADTAGFKASNVQFQTQLFRTLGIGSAPTAQNGGTNPRQIGLGAGVASITKDFTGGAVTSTTSPSDLAIQGDGFFVVESSQGMTFTRAGQFRLNSRSELVDPQGNRVLGFELDEQGDPIRGTAVPVEIRLGDPVNVAQQTTNIELSGALLPKPHEGVPIQPTIFEFDTFDSDPAGPANAILLAGLTSGGVPVFNDVITYQPMIGGKETDAATFDPTVPGATLQDFMTFVANASGIPQANVTYTQGTGIEITGLAGESNEILITPASFRSGGNDFALGGAETQTATGSMATIDMPIFDSLGHRHFVTVNIAQNTALTPGPDNRSVFDWHVVSDDTTGANRLLGSGQLEFDSSGNLVSGGMGTFSIQLDETAAESAQQVMLDFSDIAGVSNEDALRPNVLSMKSQDGASSGTLTTFAIDETGVINGILDNGLVTQLGQLALARFRSNEGLVEVGGNRYAVGPASGEPTLMTAGEFGAGTILSGAVELSNTDVGKSLVDLIVASTNYRGNARVISSVNELVDELLVLGR